MKFEGPSDGLQQEAEIGELEKPKNPLAESARAEREAKLLSIRKEVDQWGDRLGEGIDEKIKDTIAIFNATGLPTEASCEGHFDDGSDHGFPAPWVQVADPDKPEWRFEHEAEIYEQVAQKYGVTVDEVLHADNDEAWKEAFTLSAEQEETALYKEWAQKNEELLKKTELLLQEFYKVRSVTEEVRIIADRFDGRFEVHNGGKFFIPNKMRERFKNEFTEEERTRIPEILKSCQAEMALFTEFMKTKYLSEE